MEINISIVLFGVLVGNFFTVSIIVAYNLIRLADSLEQLVKKTNTSLRV